MSSWAQMKRWRKDSEREPAVEPLRLKDPTEALQQSDQDATPTWPRKRLAQKRLDKWTDYCNFFLPSPQIELPSLTVCRCAFTNDITLAGRNSIPNVIPLWHSEMWSLPFFPGPHPLGPAARCQTTSFFLTAISAPAAFALRKATFRFCNQDKCSLMGHRCKIWTWMCLHHQIIIATRSVNQALRQSAWQQKSCYIWPLKRRHFSLQGSRVTRPTNTVRLK